MDGTQGTASSRPDNESPMAKGSQNFFFFSTLHFRTNGNRKSKFCKLINLDVNS